MSVKVSDELLKEAERCYAEARKHIAEAKGANAAIRALAATQSFNFGRVFAGQALLAKQQEAILDAVARIP